MVVKRETREVKVERYTRKEQVSAKPEEAKAKVKEQLLDAGGADISHLEPEPPY